MKKLLCMLGLVALVPACAGQQEQPMRLRCELSMPTSLEAGQAPYLTFALSNTGGEPVQVLVWQTPFEGMRGAMFTVMRDGVAVEYHGAMVKRGAPRAEQYLTLKPGERKQAIIDLSGGWDVAGAGTYTVEYSSQLFDVVEGVSAVPRALDQLTAFSPTCNALEFTRLR